MRNRGILILIIVLVIVTIVLVVLALFPFANKGGVNPNELIPTPTTTEIVVPTPSDLNKEAISTVTYSSQAAQLNQRPFSLANLILLLPYQGNLFSLTYDYETDSFNLTLNSQRAIDSKEEFESFLKQNKIESSLWIENIITSYK